MRIITLWAYRHVVFARILIATIHIYFIIAALMVAGIWQKNGTNVSIGFCFFIIGVSIVTACKLHFVKKKYQWSGWSGIGYVAERTKYFFVALAAFVSLLTWFYTNSHIRFQQNDLRGSFSSMVAEKNAKTPEVELC